MNTETDSKCRLCQQFDETIDHIISACPILAKEQLEIQRMWNVKTKVIPAITVATGTISKTFRKYVSNIPGNHEVKELKKTAILGTAHKLRKVLM